MTEKLAAGGTVSFSPRGESMLPMLREEGDTVTLIKPPKRIGRGAVALFASEYKGERRYVLHRLVARNGEDYIFCGDKRKVCDPPAARGDIIGVVAGYESRGKKRSVRSLTYRLYSLWMVATYRHRDAAFKIQNFAGRIRQRLLRLGKTEN